MEKSKVILVGGFLGAGKTTMMHAAAEKLKESGRKVGLITNDQATNLVDTYLLTGYNNIVYEVSGSCFCCNFPGFDAGVANVISQGAEVVLSEPVGSCTDLSATIMQALKDLHRDDYEISPLTVMVDPVPLRGILAGEKATAYYIMTKQLDEADVILINKIDLLTNDEAEKLTEMAAGRWPQAKVMTASVKEDRGVDEWLGYVMGESYGGTHLADVDYDIYADGEAAYGWVNATYRFADDENDEACELKAAALLEKLGASFDGAHVSVGHVKFLFQSRNHQWMGNLTGKADTAQLRDKACGSESVMLTVNARVEMGPKALQDIVIGAIDEIYGSYTCSGTEIHSLIPGRPNPTYHYTDII